MVSVHSSENGIVRATNEHSGMSIMMDMRKLSNHPLLMRYYYTDQKVFDLAKRLSTHPMWKKSTNPQYIFEDLAICSDFQLYQTIEKYVRLLFSLRAVDSSFIVPLLSSSKYPVWTFRLS